MKILHVVRRYGPVGGMERYVWELTHELRKLGHEVEVLCELLPSHTGADASAVGKDLQSRIKTMCGVSTRVKVGAPDSVERTLTGKARRVIDKRPK